MNEDNYLQVATFAAGCFWGVEASFRELEGVIDTEVGYAGGKTEDPTYEEVCTGKTGHAEAVKILFDPQNIAYEELLDHFWKMHDPTTKNRQGPDVGSQYRSAIFYHTEEQKEKALESKEHQQSLPRMKKEIVTQIVPAKKFHKAEEYHQRYLEKNKNAGCAVG